VRHESRMVAVGFIFVMPADGGEAPATTTSMRPGQVATCATTRSAMSRNSIGLPANPAARFAPLHTAHRRFGCNGCNSAMTSRNHLCQ
jgi:hypothetical protein